MGTDKKFQSVITEEKQVFHFGEIIYIHTIALDRALASLTGFMIVRYIRCGVISPTINLVLAT
jgi:hypothetical protein